MTRAGLLLMIFAWFGLTSMSAASVRDEQCQFRHGPTHPGTFTGAGPGNMEKRKWTLATGNKVVASPIVCNDVLYVGSTDGWLYAADSRTGDLKWRFRADAPITATAAVADGKVYFQSNANTIYAVNATSGRQVWRRKTGPTLSYVNVKPGVDLWDYWASSPLYTAGRIFIGGGDGFVRALDARSGRLLWSHGTGARVRATPASDGKSIFVGSFNGNLYSLSAADGQLNWRFRVQGNETFKDGAIQGSPTIADGKVIFGSRDYWLYALDAANGREVWKTRHDGSWIIGTPAVHATKACVGSSDLFITQCVDLASGKELWRSSTRSNMFSSPAIVGEMLYIGSFTGSIWGLNLADGATRSGHSIDGSVNSSPWIEGDTLFVGSDNGNISAFTNEPQS